MSKLRVVAAHRPPFVFVTNTSSGPYFSGLLIELLNKILTNIAISYPYEIYLSPSNAGGTLSNGTWNGVVGELVAQRADIALFPLTRTGSRLAYIDCTYSYYDAGLALLVGDGRVSPGPLSVLAPFSLTLWMTLLATVIGVALLFWGLDVYGRWIRNKQFDALRASGVLTDRQVARAKKEDGNPVLISFMAAAGAPERPGRNSWGVQVLYVVYCFFCLIVLSSYTANLTSYLAVRQSYVGVSGLQDLAKGNFLVAINPNGSTDAYFTNSKDTLATQLQPNLRRCDSVTCVDWVRRGVVRAFVTDQPALVYIAQQQPCDLAVVGDPFGPGNLVIGLQKNSSLLPLFNAAMQILTEDGTLTSLRRAWFDGLSQCENGSQLDNSRLTISQLLGAFVFLAIGVLVAFTTGTVENLKWCLARAYARSYTENSLQGSRSFTMQSSDGQMPRSSLLVQQASRLRAATWRRLSTAVLGIHMRPSGQADADPLASMVRSSPPLLPSPPPPPPPPRVTATSEGTTFTGPGDCVSLPFSRGTKGLALSLAKFPSAKLDCTISDGCVDGRSDGDVAADLDTAPPHNCVVIMHDGAEASSIKGSSGSVCGNKASNNDGGGGEHATFSGGSPSARSIAANSPVVGSALQLPPMMPSVDVSVRFSHRESDRALPGQLSRSCASGSNQAVQPLPPPPPTRFTQLPSSRKRSSESGGEERAGPGGGDDDGSGQQPRSAMVPQTLPLPRQALNGTSTSICGTAIDVSLSRQDELTTFSGDGSSSRDYAGDTHNWPSFTGNWAAAAAAAAAAVVPSGAPPDGQGAGVGKNAGCPESETRGTS
ncbi:hypothetical protein Vretimale_8129 [Volvox reticuliferus]|uniref:Ionotropic glutamate receptor C-terminal domain-containing protein n=1 Tax=Volvox reticuliferus TaxID=1737510 RepID=A0A8J4GAZ4_9CHLO|nr:hypothetical protein Vretifemale_5276 [Volvox reticuliferus]GIM03382.1 hypothetical protein Vretimale_8129 [Volvox reticuliferus]